MMNNRLSPLDRILLTAGENRLRREFRELASRNRNEALRLLDDDRLQFPVLFTLLPEIQTYKLTGELSPRNFTAVTICVKKIKALEPLTYYAQMQDSESLYRALLWMFKTGKSWDGASGSRDDFDSVIDYATALLVITFEDTSILPDMVDLIFSRNRRGRLIHELVWSFFQTLDHDALILVAGQLLSQDSRDVALACELLCLEVPSAGKTETKNLHGLYVDWLKDNRPYLYVTGEHFQQTSRPKHLSVDMEAKYLGKELSPRYRAPIEPLTAHEIACLHEYRGFSPEEQELLTDYSHRLRYSDARSWEAWMGKQVAEQVISARSGYEIV